MLNKFNGAARWILVGIAVLGGLSTTIGFSYTSHNSATSAVVGMNEIRADMKANNTVQAELHRKAQAERVLLDRRWLETISELKETLAELKIINKQLSEITRDHETRFRTLEKP